MVLELQNQVQSFDAELAKTLEQENPTLRLVTPEIQSTSLKVLGVASQLEAVDHAASGNNPVEFELQGEGEIIDLARSIDKLIQRSMKQRPRASIDIAIAENRSTWLLTMESTDVESSHS